MSAAPISDSKESRENPAPLERERRGCLVMLGGLAALMAAAATGLRVAMARVEAGAEWSAALVTQIYIGMWYHGMAAAVLVIALMFIRRRRLTSPRLPRAAVLFCTLIFLASVDQLVGLAFPAVADNSAILTPHPTRGWYHRRDSTGPEGGVQIHTNALGFRGNPLSDRKPPHALRVLFLGDSITFGFALPDNQTYVEQTHATLASRLPNIAIRTINAGVCGYATGQELDLLAHEGLQAQPDLVILQFCLNDMLDVIAARPGTGRTAPARLATQPDHWSGIVRAIQTWQAKRERAKVGDRPNFAQSDVFRDLSTGLAREEDLWANPPKPAVTAGWRRALDDLDQMRRFCEERRLPWVLVYFPVLQQIGPNSASIRPQAPLTNWAQTHGVAYLDLSDAFRAAAAAAGGDGHTLLIDTDHPNARGSQLAAETLAEFITANTRLTKPHER